MKKILSIVAVSVLAGCAGKVDYIRPTIQPKNSNSKIIDKPRDAVWNSAVPALGKQFYVINNLDKSSGLINLSYNGNPELYIDCGRITSYVQNARGERTYNFSGAKQDQQYEVMTPDYKLLSIQRKMSLDGRINLIFEELGPSQTRVTANTRYVVTKTVQAQVAGGGFPHTASDAISFNSGSGASYPSLSDGSSTECRATGRMEEEILSIIN